MKRLKETFESNFDKVGVQTFTQIRREFDVNGEKEYAMYKRTRSNGTVHGFELFEIKIRLEGQPLPGGMFEPEDRECYPGANSFGRTAWDFKFEDHANEAFDNLLNTGHPFCRKIRSVKNNTSPELDELKIPDDDFVIDEMVEMNDDSKPNIYLKLKQLISIGVVEVVGEVKTDGQRGRAKKLYSKVLS